MIEAIELLMAGTRHSPFIFRPPSGSGESYPNTLEPGEELLVFAILIFALWMFFRFWGWLSDLRLDDEVWREPKKSVFKRWRWPCLLGLVLAGFAINMWGWPSF